MYRKLWEIQRQSFFAAKSLSGSADATSVGEPAFSEGGSDHLPHDSSTWPSVSANVGCVEIAFGPVFLGGGFSCRG